MPLLPISKNMTIDFCEIELTENNSHIFTIYLPSLNPDIEKLWEFLSEYEKNQAEKITDGYSRKRYIVSHGFLRCLLSVYVRIKPQNIKYLSNKFGKIFLEDNNYRIQFNMSHSKDYAAYIIALDYQVGIDIEWKGKSIDIQRVAEFVLSPREIIIFNKLAVREKIQIFYDMWTKKEAIIKAIGQGLSCPLMLIEVINYAGIDKSHLIINGDKFYYVALQGLADYAGSIAIAHKLVEFVHVDLACAFFCRNLGLTLL